MNALFLAAANLRFHWGRTLVLVLAAALLLAVPVLTRALLARGEAAPLLLGTRGSRLDLVMAGAYFTDDLPEPTTMATVDAVWDSDVGVPVPLHLAFTARRSWARRWTTSTCGTLRWPRVAPSPFWARWCWGPGPPTL